MNFNYKGHVMEEAIQDLLGPENHCHGCGPNNELGFRLKSFREGEKYICKYTPKPHQCAGLTTVLNGGVIASLIDCHSVGSAMADAYLRENREIGSLPKIWYVTATLQVNYLKPTPISNEVLLVARIDKSEGRKTWVNAELSSNGILCATGDVLAIRIERPI